MNKKELRAAVQEMNTYQFGQKKELTNKLSKVTSYVLKQEVVDMVSKLDKEVKPELPVVPQFVADWIKECKTRKHNLFGVYQFSPEVVSDWIFENESKKERVDLIARAWLSDYTIEKEPMYLVKVNDQGSCLYLKSMQLYKDVESRTDLNSNFEAWKEKAIKFTNKEQAEGIAKFFNGEVVEVTDNV